MQALRPRPLAPDRDSPARATTISPFCAVGFGGLVPAQPVCSPVHTVVIGLVGLRLGIGTTPSDRGVAVPPGVTYGVAHAAPYSEGLAVHLDARYYSPEDSRRLARKWRSVQPGRDDPLLLLEDALRVPRRRLDRRLETALAAIEAGGTVAQAAYTAGLSQSRLTHLTSDILGAPPRHWRPWLRMRLGIGHMITGASITEAAHAAGFADGAHFTRTCRAGLGATPSELLSRRTRILVDGTTVTTLAALKAPDEMRLRGALVRGREHQAVQGRDDAALQRL